MRNIYPSFLQVEGVQNQGYNGEMMDNVRLRLGEVQAFYYPSDPKNVSKKVTEYTIYVQHKANETGAGRMYERCTISNLFGGIADKFEYTLRKDDSATRNQPGGIKGIGLGSKVLLLCINGETHNAVIIGGIHDSQDTATKDLKGLGHHLHWVFNGIDCFINDNGELTVTHKGKTDLKGKTNTEHAGTAVSFTEDGNFNVNANHNIQLKSEGVLIGDATDKTILGSTYRSAESSMLNSIKSSLGSVAASLAAAALSLGFGDTGGAAGSLASAAGALEGAVSAIEEFEGSSNDYLSDKNRSD